MKGEPSMLLKSLKLRAGIIFFLITLPGFVFAQPPRFENPLSGISTIPDFINELLSIVIMIAIPVIVIMIVYSGFLFVTARGNEERVSKARTNFLYVVIGTAVILGAKLLASAIAETIQSL